jgi:nitric oxide reductase NorF protein
MIRTQAYALFYSFITLILLAIIAALIAVQWQAEPLPIGAVAAILGLAILKARLIILDFLNLRGQGSLLSPALLAWPSLFAVAALAKMTVLAMMVGG